MDGDERSRSLGGAQERPHVWPSGFDRHGSATQLLRYRCVAVNLSERAWLVWMLCVRCKVPQELHSMP